MSHSRVRGRCVPGFTLIEILVVVAMIALLVSILLPSLRNAREQSRAMVCGEHLNQIFTATFMYAQQNQDRLPHFGYRSDSKNIDWWWPTQLAPLIFNQFELYTCPTDRNRTNIYLNFDTPRLIKMWASSTQSKTKVPMGLSFRGCCDLLNGDVKWPVNGTLLGPMPRRINEFKRPAMSLILVEGNIDGTATTEQCYRYSDLLPFINGGTSKKADIKASWRRHLGKNNYLFLDGHVGRHTADQGAKTIMYQQQFGPTR